MNSLALLSIFIDFLVASTLVSNANVLLPHVGMLGQSTSYAASAAIAIGLRAFQGRFSPGQRILETAVDERHRVGERRRQWPNLVLGTLLFLEGTKHLARWMMPDRIVPLFGIAAEGGAQIGVDIGSGIVLVAIGTGILRFNGISLYACWVWLGAEVVSTAMSWQIMFDELPQMYAARRKLQGLPVREGAAEQMQFLLPIVLVAFLAVYTLLLFLSRAKPEAAD